MLALVASGLLLTWMLCTAVLIGLGSLTLRKFGDGCGLMENFWMGLAVAVAFLEIWSLLRPITRAAALALAAIGVLGLAWNGKTILRKAREALAGVGWTAAVYVLIAGYIALRSCGPCDYYDTGLYGAQAIHWITSYPVVPGLANLHERFGFNSSIYLCDAAMVERLWANLYFHFFTGWILAALWAAIFPSVARVVRGAPGSVVEYFQAILVIPAAAWATRAKIVGTINDQPAAVACLVAAAILFSELSPREGESRAEGKGSEARIVVATAVLALAITFKLSVIVFAASAWAVAFVWLWRASRESRQRGAWMAAAILIPAAILVPWLVRGVILSGYPFYPSTALGLSADWRLPAAVANIEAAGIRTFALNHNSALTAPARIMAWGGFGETVRWFLVVVRNRDAFQAPLGFSLLGAATLLGCRPLTGGEGRKPRRPLWLLLPSLAGIVFWLAKAPDPRFGQAAIWTVAATLGSLGIAACTACIGWPPPRLVAAGLFVTMLWCLFSYDWRQSYRPLASVRELAPLPIAHVEPHQTDSGLTVYVPATGDQCWDAPLPCTPYFDGTLRLRFPGDPSGGFTSKGLQYVPIEQAR